MTWRRFPGSAVGSRRAALALARVRGASMEPTLRDGDLLVTRSAAQAAPGDLVVVDLPGARPRSVKRLIRRDADGWWVERDNPREGVDSWSVGAVPPGHLVAVVVLRLWPRPRRFTRERLIPRS